MFKKDNKVICIEDNAWVKKGCKGIVIQEGNSINSPYVLWESDGTVSENIELYVKAKYLQLLEEPKSESLKPEDLIPREEPEGNLVGRYIKALVDNPAGIGMNIGEYLLITRFNTDYATYDVTRVRDNKAGFGIEVCHLFKFELMPIGFNPKVESKFIVGAWYKIKNCKIAYRKCLEIPTEDYLPYVESIENGEYLNDSISKCYALHRLQKVDISEIQQYLPEGHVDKVNTTEDPLITEAKRRYPIGTAFYPVHLSQKSEYCIVTNTNFKLSGTDIYALTDDEQIYDPFMEGKYGSTHYDRCVYTDGKWAEIITLGDSKNTNPEEFKVGDWIYFLTAYDGEKVGSVVQISGIDPDTFNGRKGWIRYKQSSFNKYGGGFAWEGDGYKLGIHFRLATPEEIAKAQFYKVTEASGDFEVLIPDKHLKYPLVLEECFTFVKPKKKEYPFDEQAYLSKPFNQKLELNLKVKTNKKSKITI